ncbi:MAG: 5'-nucleotidase [Bacteroidales bacterium]|jgi:2',3'-cyclic-nucleotide 2'-phosphodiesterase (5'-nucleotidase family)
MTRKILTFLTILLIAGAVQAQELHFSFKGSRILMDSTLNKPEEPVVKGIIEFFKPEMDRIMQEVVGESEAEMRSGRPESLLSNFAVDALFEFAQKHSKEKVNFSLTNFGGIRATLPKGNVRRYDIFSIFPFENYVVVLDVTGASVRKLLESFAANRVEAMSYNVQLEIKGGVLKEALIDGVQIDDSKIYRIATIDFLLSGGDNVMALKEAVAVEQTGFLIRDAIFEKIADIRKRGEKIRSSLTNRVEIED